ncbi:unnamed protein product [Paramecium sonneborni]|uniref:Uncharacterized protein n=1 Tax=Paramecium sonneborni TaxID=65129 RepID=A0A8S1L6U4_9CILI|nr:unnamed protein product [Paramecium sonneborni]
MLEKSKIKQILLDKSLGQILKVEKLIQSIQQDELILPFESFNQHFHTTAGKEFVAIPRFKTNIDQATNQNWKCVRPRTPSTIFKWKRRITIFDQQKDISQQQELNTTLSWEPIRKHIPLDKQTKRKPWIVEKVFRDYLVDQQKSKTVCFVNYARESQNKEPPKYYYHIDDNKATQTYFKLKPNYQRRNVSFAKFLERNNASPSLKKF